MGGLFDLENKKKSLEKLKEELNDPSIWNNPTVANEKNSILVNLQKQIINYEKIVNDIEENIELINLIEDEDLTQIDIKTLNEEVLNLEKETLLTEKYDNNSCFLEIHPGAGGTEACDWAEMLFRMYESFANKNNYKFEVIDKQNGDVAGIKSALIYISGNYPYGYFKSEQGVHRLVRISPFDSGARRHTSFAAVSVTPEIKNTKKIEIKADDLKIDVYRSSGKGGQGVNTTDSAVRITHLPTGIVITCQNERSQIRNKETALNILQSKLEHLASETQKSSLDNLKNTRNIEFGSQIRNYTLEPYKLVKDVRTNYETSNAEDVLNGNIMPFMNAYLRMKR